MIARSPFKSPQQILSSPEDSSYPQDWGEYVELLKSEKRVGGIGCQVDEFR